VNTALNLDALYPVTLTKCCTKCHRCLPVDAFRQRHDKSKPERSNHCRECESAYKRERRALLASGEPKRLRIVSVDGRHPEDAACDAAFRDWRDIGARGVDLGWRV
jgi:hypothetical protein